MVYFKDISYAQGEYDMDSNSDPAIMMKMSGFYTGSKQPYYDAQAARNYNNAVRTGKVPMLYHFAGGADPIVEADWFIKACSPLAVGDILALDWEIEADDPVGWITAFVEHVHANTGIWPWVYMDIDRVTRFDWSNVLNRCALWLAAPSYGFDDNIPGVQYSIMAQQGPIVDGVDTDAFFGTIDQLRLYGYGSSQQAPSQPQPTPTPVPLPDPVPPTPETPVDPSPPVTPTPPDPVTPVDPPVVVPPVVEPGYNIKTVIAGIIAGIATLAVIVLAWINS